MTLHAKPAEKTRLVISERTRSSPSLASVFGLGAGGNKRLSALAPPLRFSARARMVLNRITAHEPYRAPSLVGGQNSAALVHLLDEAVWPHVGPVPFNEFQARSTAVRLVNDGPAGGNVDEARPKGVLPLFVDQNVKEAVF